MLEGSTGVQVTLMTSTVTRNTGSTIKYAVIAAVLANLSYLDVASSWSNSRMCIRIGAHPAGPAAGIGTRPIA